MLEYLNNKFYIGFNGRNPLWNSEVHFTLRNEIYQDYYLSFLFLLLHRYSNTTNVERL